MVKRKGLFQIAVNQTVEFVLGDSNTNNFGKQQFSGYIGDDYYYLPTHQELVDSLANIRKGCTIRATRLTKGGEKQTAHYKIELIAPPKEIKKSQVTLDSF